MNLISNLLDKILSNLRVSRLKWRDLRDVEPISRKFGFDRGLPIDRFYIEKFLFENKSSITGKVLEVAESNYSKKFGHNVKSFEVLHVEKTAKATIVGDLTLLSSLPQNEVDCFVCTQVLNFIFDFKSAIEGIHFLLVPGGTALVTVSGISQISRYDADQWGHFWSFYPQGILKHFEAIFGKENVQLKCYGNSLTAISFLKGIASNELTVEELNFLDQDYPVTISIVAKKEKKI